MPPAGEGTTSATSPNCSDVRRKARFNIYFDKVDIEKLVQTVSDATCKTFILGENVRGKISIIGPDNGKVDVGADEFYAAFLAALDANQPRRRTRTGASPRSWRRPRPSRATSRVVGPDEPYTTNEQMITRLFKIRYVDLEPLRGVLQQLVSQNGRHHPLPAGHADRQRHRLEHAPAGEDHRAARQPLELRRDARDPDSATPPPRTWPTSIQKLFEAKANRPGRGPGSPWRPLPPPTREPPSDPGAAVQPGGQPGAVSGGPATVTTAHRRRAHQQAHRRRQPRRPTNASMPLLREIDVPDLAARGGSTSTPCENANAEDIAATLQSLAQGTANRPRAAAQPPQNIPGAPPPPQRPATGRGDRGRALPGRGEDLRRQGHQLAGGGRQPVPTTGTWSGSSRSST